MDFNDSFGQYNNNSFGEENKNNASFGEENKNKNDNNNISFEGNNNNNNISFEENNNNNNISFEGNNNNCNDKNNNNNNNISFEGNNNDNNNNISFEENKNNNLSFDNIQMDDNFNNKNEEEEKKENEIFNSVPMEIQNQENQDILYYQNLLITENIKHNLTIIFNAIKKNILYNKIKFFYELKNRADYKYSKLVKAEMIFMSMKNKLNVFSHIEKVFRYKILKENFTNLKKYSNIIKYRVEQDKIKENEMKKKIKETNEVLKKNENNLKDVSDSVDKLIHKEKNLNNEISELNKKYNKLNEKYNNLAQKSKSLKDCIKKKMENYSLTLDKTIEPKISELQNIIKNKEKEKEKSMNYFEEFYKKMNDMLEIYETNYESIKSTRNSSTTSNA